jgi:hypothetical protein
MMKRRPLLIPLLLCCLAAACNNEPPETSKDLLPASLVHNPQSANGLDSASLKGLPGIAFHDTLHNFGTMQEGEVGEYEFSFTNTGSGPLLISGADASCGCTATNYPLEPVAPGKGASMKVTFNSAGKQGHVEKTITVTSNAATGARHLFIQADVTPKK